MGGDWLTAQETLPLLWQSDDRDSPLAHLLAVSSRQNALVPYLTGNVQPNLGGKFKMRVHKYGDPTATVARVAHSSFFTLRDGQAVCDHRLIECCTGIDVIALVALAIAVEKIKEEKAKEKREANLHGGGGAGSG